MAVHKKWTVSKESFLCTMITTGIEFFLLVKINSTVVNNMLFTTITFNVRKIKGTIFHLIDN